MHCDDELGSACTRESASKLGAGPARVARRREPDQQSMHSQGGQPMLLSPDRTCNERHAHSTKFNELRMRTVLVDATLRLLGQRLHIYVID